MSKRYWAFLGLFAVTFTLSIFGNIRFDSTSRIANDSKDIIRDEIKKCGIEIELAHKIGIPVPPTSAYEVWINSKHKIIAYTETAVEMNTGSSAWILKLPNGANLAAISEPLSQVILQTHQGIVATAIEALNANGLVLHYYCYGSKAATPAQLNQCITQSFLIPIIKWACSQ